MWESDAFDAPLRAGPQPRSVVRPRRDGETRHDTGHPSTREVSGDQTGPPGAAFSIVSTASIVA